MKGYNGKTLRGKSGGKAGRWFKCNFFHSQKVGTARR